MSNEWLGKSVGELISKAEDRLDLPHTTTLQDILTAIKDGKDAVAAQKEIEEEDGMVQGSSRRPK